MMAEDTSRRRTLGLVGMALLHKFPSQQAMAPPHAMLVWQPLVTKSKPAKDDGENSQIPPGIKYSNMLYQLF